MDRPKARLLHYFSVLLYRYIFLIFLLFIEICHYFSCPPFLLHSSIHLTTLGVKMGQTK